MAHTVTWDEVDSAVLITHPVNKWALTVMVVPWCFCVSVFLLRKVQMRWCGLVWEGVAVLLGPTRTGLYQYIFVYQKSWQNCPFQTWNLVESPLTWLIKTTTTTTTTTKFYQNEMGHVFLAVKMEFKSTWLTIQWYFAPWQTLSSSVVGRRGFENWLTVTNLVGIKYVVCTAIFGVCSGSCV